MTNKAKSNKSMCYSFYQIISCGLKHIMLLNDLHHELSVTFSAWN